jgi:DNA-binding transcriptional ArsR family regulator
MQPEELLALLGARSRLLLLGALARRPHTLGELARVAEISIQATLKHVRLLEKKGLVEQLSLAKVGVGPRALYVLSLPVMLELGADDEVLRLWAFVSRKRLSPGGALTGTPTKAPLGSFMELEDDARMLQRRIRGSAQRMGRLFRLLRDVRGTQAEIVHQLGLDGAGELLLRTFLEGGGVDIVEQTARQLGIREEVSRRVLRLIRSEGSG